FGHESVVREVQAVARTAVPFEVVPGISQAAGVATYAGVPLPGVRVPAELDDAAGLDFEALAAAGGRGAAEAHDAAGLGFEGLAAAVARGSAAVAVDAGELAAVRDGLLAAGI